MAPFSSADEVFLYVEKFTNLEKGEFLCRDFRLDRMRYLIEEAGRPDRGLVLIHAAGSKGKGSTCLFMASILSAAGHRTGLYTSPHVVSYAERTRFGDGEIADETFRVCGGELRGLVESRRAEDFPGGALPSTFELLTLLAFLCFRRERCTHAVIETGIGGRLDATNVIVPAASVLTPVELEHTEILGSTIRLIAGEKAGIIKPGVPVFSSKQRPEAASVFREYAEMQKAPLVFVGEALKEAEYLPKRRSVRLLWNDGRAEEFRVRMEGDVQAENAALALLCLRSLFPGLGAEACRVGLERAFLPGRFERIADDPPLYVDAAHTPGSVARILPSLRKRHPEGFVLLFGSVLGKNPEEMARLFSESGLVRAVVIARPGTFKPSDPVEVHGVFRRYFPEADFVPEAEAALARVRALAAGRLPILVAGSFYMVGEIRKLVLSTQGNVSDRKEAAS